MNYSRGPLRFSIRANRIMGVCLAKSCDIIGLAGGPGDRWLGWRKPTEREESPDTAVVGSQEPVTETLQTPNRVRRVKRATRLITSGEQL